MATTPTTPPAGATGQGRGAARTAAAALTTLTALTALCALGPTAAAASGIDYEKAGNYPTLDACADAGHSMSGIKSWLCDEEPDGTVTLYVVPA